jgi:hypothetical protein
MRAWCWLVAHFPIVVTTRQRQWQYGKDAFEVGRDYERGKRRELASRVERLEAQVHELTA